MCVRTLILTTCCAALIASAGAAQQVERSGGETRISLEAGVQLARGLLQARQSRAALNIAETLLQANPDDPVALTILAQANLQLGNIQQARTAARSAYRNGTTQRERFNAAFTMADVLAANESYTASQLWLRRAIENAPGPQSQAVAESAFRTVRAENPASINLSFGLRPSNNINSGNFNETIAFTNVSGAFSNLEFAVPASERPLSGLEVSAQADLRYRLRQSAISRTSAEFGFYGRTFILSDSARSAAPDVSGSSLSYTHISTGLLHQWAPQNSNNVWSTSLGYSYAWFGGDPFLQNLEWTLGSQTPLNERNTLQTSITVGFADYVNRTDDILTYSLRTHWTNEQSNNDVIGVTAQIAVAESDNETVSYDGLTLGFSYDFGTVMPGLDLSASAQGERRNYEGSSFNITSRSDDIISVDLEAGFTAVDVYGFEPVVSLRGHRRDSSDDFFDTESVSLGVNIRSSF